MTWKPKAGHLFILLGIVLGVFVPQIRALLSDDYAVPGWVIAIPAIMLVSWGRKKWWRVAVEAFRVQSKRSPLLWRRLLPISALLLQSRFVPFAVLFAEVLVFFRKPLFVKPFMIPFDLEGYHLPLAAFIARSVQNWEFPWWDPFSYCGVPFYANLQAQVFYPPAWPVFLIGSLNRYLRNVFLLLEWQVAIHVFLGGAFAFLLLRRLRLSRGSALFGATVFQLGAFFASQAQHLGVVSAAAWLPLAWLAVLMLRDGFEWRALGVLTLALSLSILAGFPSMTAVVFGSSLLLAVLLVLLKRGQGKLIAIAAMGCVWAILLSAVLLLPSLELSRLSLASRRGEWQNGGGVPLQALLSMVVPNYHHVFDPENYTLPQNCTFVYLYCSLAAVLFCGLAVIWSKHKERLVFVLLTLASAIWMFGIYTPAGKTLFPLLPKFMKGGLYLEFGMAPFVLGVAVLAAFGAERFVAVRGKAFSAALIVVTAIDLTAVSSNRFMNTGKGSTITYEHFYQSRETPERMRRLVNETTPPSRTDIVDGSQTWALAAPHTEVPSASGDDPLALLRTLAVRRCFTKGEFWQRFSTVASPESPLLDLLNVRFLVTTPRQPISAPGFIRRARLPLGDVYENTQVLPRFFLVSHVRSAKSLDDAISIIGAADFDPRRTVVVENAPQLSGVGQQPFLPPVKVLRYERRSLEVETNSPAPGYLVTSEAYYPGWRCRLDGREQPILLINAAFRGLPVPAGVHRITMQFEPRILFYGAAISLLALALLIAAIFKSSRIP